MNQVKTRITHFRAQAYLSRWTNIKLFKNCCQQCGWDEIDYENGNCITSEWVVFLSAFWKNTFSYSSNGIIISFKDGFEKSTQHLSFIRFYVVESFNRDFGSFIFRFWFVYYILLKKIWKIHNGRVWSLFPQTILLFLWSQLA